VTAMGGELLAELPPHRARAATCTAVRHRQRASMSIRTNHSKLYGYILISNIRVPRSLCPGREGVESTKGVHSISQ
jgi:hypothetical protein